MSEEERRKREGIKMERIGRGNTGWKIAGECT
jgi:hypothetical protein